MRHPLPAMAENVDFEAEGLLDGVGPEDRPARLELLGQLVDAGTDLSELKRAAAEDRLEVLPAELVFEREARHSVEDALAESVLSEDFVRRDLRALGLPMPPRGEPALTDDDLEAWRMLGRILDAGLPEERVLELARVAGRTGAQLAEAIVDGFVRTFARQGESSDTAGLRFAGLVVGLMPALGPLVEAPVRMHLRELVRHEVVERTEEIARGLPGAREVTVCFADLVEFTRLSEAGPVEAAGHAAGRLDALAAEAAEPPVRLVKLIGDAAMLAAPDATAVVRAAARLLAGAEHDDALPRLRAGVASGAALNRGGDWYGRPVNLASRVTGIAAPGAIVATAPVADATGGSFEWQPIGAHELKGIEEPVELFGLREARR
jgi:adenylate cyclase